MRETLKMMKGILTGKEGKANEKELIGEYQNYLLPNILAYFYVNNFGIISNTSNLYPLLLDEDKASFCLQELDKCLQTFDITVSNKFVTYFIKCYKNRLRTETETIMTSRKKAMINTIDIDDMELPMESNIENIDIILADYKLELNDINQCKLLYAGYSFKEIAKIMKQAPITIYKRSARIKEKIRNYGINFV